MSEEKGKGSGEKPDPARPALSLPKGPAPSAKPAGKDPAAKGTLKKKPVAPPVIRPDGSPAAGALLTADLTRRGFLGLAGALPLAWASFTAASGATLAALGRFMFPNVLFEPPTTVKIGPPEQYTVGEVDERWKAKYGIWVIRTEEGFYALLAVCTHLGCTPNWLANARKFKCPCHGSGFRKSGINFEGPAPRPLERLRIELGPDGQIVVDKDKKYQQEKGQWEDPGAFLFV